jgi:hypothetical protein
MRDAPVNHNLVCLTNFYIVGSRARNTVGAALSPQTEHGPDLSPQPPKPPRGRGHYPPSILSEVLRSGYMSGRWRRRFQFAQIKIPDPISTTTAMAIICPRCPTIARLLAVMAHCLNGDSYLIKMIVGEADLAHGTPYLMT